MELDYLRKVVLNNWQCCLLKTMKVNLRSLYRLFKVHQHLILGIGFLKEKEVFVNVDE